MRRRPFYKSLYFRFGFSFLIVLTLSSVVQQFLTVKGWERLSSDLEQRLNWNIASEIAQRLQPELSGNYSREWLQERLFTIEAIHPSFKIYLLDAEGTVIDHFGRDSHAFYPKVPLAPIHEALTLPRPALPLLGSDPMSRNRRAQSIFSVAPTIISGRDGYLYVVLNNRMATILKRQQGQLYVFGMIAAFSLSTIVLSAITAFLLFRLLSRDFRRLQSMLNRFEQGDLDARVSQVKDDETGDMALAFNHMAERIQRNIAELASVDQRRRDLVANVSHDLRSPLTVIDGYIDIVLNDYDKHSDEQRKKFLAIIHRNLQSQKKLVSDLFELSKLEAKEITADIEDCDFNEFVEQLCDTYLARCAEAGIELRSDLQGSALRCLADHSMLRRVLVNLLENAIRYTPRGGSITIRARQLDKSLHIEVEDTGQGIPPEDLPHIFDSFYRVEKDRSKESGGTGLGLAIVQKMLEAQAADIAVQSTPGVGTRFSFELASGAP